MPGLASALVGMKLKGKRFVVVARNNDSWIFLEAELVRHKSKADKKEKKEKAAAAVAAATPVAQAPSQTVVEVEDDSPTRDRSNSLQDRMARLSQSGGAAPQFSPFAASPNPTTRWD